MRPEQRTPSAYDCFVGLYRRARTWADENGPYEPTWPLQVLKLVILLSAELEHRARRLCQALDAHFCFAFRRNVPGWDDGAEDVLGGNVHEGRLCRFWFWGGARVSSCGRFEARTEDGKRGVAIDRLVLSTPLPGRA